MTNMGYLTTVTVTSSFIVFEPAASHNKCCTTGWYVYLFCQRSVNEKHVVALLYFLLEKKW